jgi:hypothetical protein
MSELGIFDSFMLDPLYDSDRITDADYADGDKGSMLQNSVSSEKFSEKFSASNFGQIFTQNSRCKLI